MKKVQVPIIVLVILSILSILGVIFIGTVFYLIYGYDERGPVDFFLDERNATYSIEKSLSFDGSPRYWIHYSNHENRRTPGASIMVGNSDVELDSFVGKSIRIDGDYSGHFAKEQCIVSRCVPIGNWMVIDVFSIMEREED